MVQKARSLFAWGRYSSSGACERSGFVKTPCLLGEPTSTLYWWIYCRRREALRAIVAHKGRTTSTPALADQTKSGAGDEASTMALRGKDSIVQPVTLFRESAQKKCAQVGRELPRELLQGRVPATYIDSSEKTQSGTRSPTVSAARSVLERSYTVLGRSGLVKFSEI